MKDASPPAAPMDAPEKEGYTNKGFVCEGDTDPKGSVSPQTLNDLPAGKVALSRSEKWRILKNVSAVSVAFMIQFTAFQGTANLQSSINAADGLGTVSLCSIYAALVISCLLVPTFVIKRLTVKWTLVLSMLCYAPYIGAQFYPRFYTLVPTGIILGIAAAPMWASKATYITQVGSVYAKLTDQPVDAIIVRFFGFFFLAWQTAELWGNLISSLVLSSGVHGNGTVVSHLEACGANFCLVAKDSKAIPDARPDSEIYVISTIYLACVCVAVAMMAFLIDPLSRYGEKQISESEPSGIKLLSATVYQLKKPNQQLLIPITLWIGMEQAFIGAEFTQAYVSCALGIHSIGYVMVCFGVVNAICSLLFGSIMKFIGRVPILVLGFVVHLTLTVILLVWIPDHRQPEIFFVISGLWGVGDAVWQTQINGLYGTLFRRNKEAAFSNYRMWESMGFVIAYAYSNHLCVWIKLYIMISVLVVGFMGYLVVEVLHSIKNRIKKSRSDEQNHVEEVIAEMEEPDDERDDIDDNIIITHM